MRLTMRSRVPRCRGGPVGGAHPGRPGDGRPAAGRQRNPGRSGSRTVTLITGDRFSVATDGSHRFTVSPTPGREHVAFVTREFRDHLEVTPVDALPLVRAGRLDSRLFDVTALVAYGYDDRLADLPLIVTSSDRPRDASRDAARPSPATCPRCTGTRSRSATGTPRRTGTASPRVPAGMAALRAGVDKIWLDAQSQPTLDASVPQIGAPHAWAAGYTGAGVPVAVIDTGIDDTHPDLAGKVVAAQDFTPDGDLVDRVGHGTHVASTIAGSGAASGGRYKGVAPGEALQRQGLPPTAAGLVASSPACSGPPHPARQGGQHEPRRHRHARRRPDGAGRQTLTAQYGTLFVVAAGNAGKTVRSVSPSTADDALVGRRGRQGRAAGHFLQPGPPRGDDGIKPEITAPGVDIVAARCKDGASADRSGRPVRDHVRHVHGHPARRRRRRDPGPAAPGLDTRSAQGGPDGRGETQPRHRRVRSRAPAVSTSAARSTSTVTTAPTQP